MGNTKDVNTAVRSTSVDLGRDAYGTAGSSSKSPIEEHGNPQIVEASPERPAAVEKQTWREKLAFFKTRDFWFILALGQVLAICITGTNTLTTLLAEEGNSIPAFQTLFNYILLNVIYTSYTIYKYGFKKWLHLCIHDGWKCASTEPFF